MVQAPTASGKASTSAGRLRVYDGLGILQEQTRGNNLPGKAVVVTGACRGIAREVALLMKQGASVVVTDPGGDRSGGRQRSRGRGPRRRRGRRCRRPRDSELQVGTDYNRAA